MARIGGSGLSLTIDGYNADTNAVSAAVSLDDLTSFSGINEDGQFVDFLAYGNVHRGEIPAGFSSFSRITMGGYVNYDATNDRVDITSALARLRGSTASTVGAIASRTDYPARTLTVTYATGLTEAIEVTVAKARIMPQVDGPAMWEAELAPATEDAGDHTTTGF